MHFLHFFAENFEGTDTAAPSHLEEVGGEFRPNKTQLSKIVGYTFIAS